MGFIWGVCFEDTEITVNYKMALYENIREKKQTTKNKTTVIAVVPTLNHYSREKNCNLLIFHTIFCIIFFYIKYLLFMSLIIAMVMLSTDHAEPRIQFSS